MSAIADLIRYWFPEWEPPPDNREWNKTLCPFHAESNPSASLSHANNAFVCYGCGMKGNVISLIRRKEGVSYREAIEYAKTISVGCGETIQRHAAGQRGRPVFKGGEGVTGATRTRARFRR